MIDDELETQVLAERVRVAVTGFTVSVVAGPDLGRSITVDAPAGRVLIGSGPACALVLRDRSTSRRHCALEFDGTSLRVTDLESTNGTRANGLLIDAARVGPGDSLRIGETTLHVASSSALPTGVVPDAMSFGRVVGASPQMRRLYPLCARIAATNVSLIIEGETGTGKEVLAESIHEASPRAGKPFVVFDCTTVPPSLMESALFGHERGSFTGAISARRGAFELADGGTLLIDEIGELDLTLQPKLLRAIERAEVQRVGAERMTRVDVRVIAATRRDLDREIQERRFRDDLFFRLAVARIELPALRRREGDVGVLARHFWKHLDGDPAAIPHEVFERFERYSWPGNVRELFNAVVRCVALGDWAEHANRPAVQGNTVSADAIDEVLSLGLPLPRARERVVEEFERRYVARVLALHDGNVARAAAASGIAMRYFQLIRARSK